MFDLWLKSTPENAFARHEQLLEEARQSYIARVAAAKRVTLNQRFILWFSQTLISIGVRLRRSCTPREGQSYLPVVPFESRAQY